MKWLKRILATLLGLSAIALVLAALLGGFFLLQRARARGHRPLVLIHNPLNRAKVPLGQGVQTHATARLDDGVARVELWVDGLMLDAHDSPTGSPVNPLVLSTVWEPLTLGSHTLQVRALSQDGVEGLSTVAVEVVAPEAAPGPPVGGYIVQPGDTLESIAEELGTTPEELEDANPDLDPDGPAPGDELSVPAGAGEAASGGAEEPPPAGESPSSGDEPAPEDESAPSPGEPPPEGAAPPDPHDAPPGDVSDIVDLPDLSTFYRSPLIAYQPLRIEVLALETDAVYEALHCYVGLADHTPQWFPDADRDQTTDESFVHWGGGAWDVAAHLAGDGAAVVMWPGNEALPIDVTCVGIAGGGTQAVELGALALRIRPEAWDGNTRRAVSAGGEGEFTLDYLVGAEERSGPGFPIWLDPSMTPPTNVRLVERTNVLAWDYFPRDDEEPIDGFRIYLDDTLQWAEPADSRAALLPGEWLRPECGMQYHFTVTAFRHGFPDGPESPPSDPPALYPPDEPRSTRCEPEVVVQFHTLTTGDLGGDGRYEDRTGDVGPVYGTFFAGGQSASFDGRSTFGLYHNSEYNVNGFTVSPWLRGTGMSRFYIQVSEEEALYLGFDIWDDDTRNADDPICNGDIFLSSRDLQEQREGSISTDAPSGAPRDRCVVTYSVNRVGGPVSGYGGAAPLPHLRIEDFSVHAASGQLRIHVSNQGLATWNAHDLDVEVLRHSGDPVIERTWEDFFLAPGDSAILQFGEAFERPLDVCAALDPNDQVAEEGEPTGAFSTYRVRCSELPDLVITNVEYDAERGRLLATVENVGAGDLTQPLSLQLRVPDGRTYPVTPAGYPLRTLGRWDSTVLELPLAGISRDGLRAGYTVIVDPMDDLAESDESNNEFDVPGSRYIWLDWHSACATRYVSGRVHHFSIHLNADVVGGGSSRRVADWSAPEIDLYWLTEGGYRAPDEACWVDGSPNEYVTDGLIEVGGDEQLVVSGSATADVGARDYPIGSFRRVIDVRDDANTEPLREVERECFRSSDAGQYSQQVYGTIPLENNGDWSVSYGVCREP